MNLKKDDGVSSAVAIMLILSIVVIGVTVFLGTYLPDMKETSEIQNSADIRETFMNYASAVDSLYYTNQIGQSSWTIQLGAGDVIISPSKSSGILELKPPDSIVTVSSPENLLSTISCDTVDIEYSPSSTYWRNIGYLYSRGVVSVTNPSEDTPYFTLSNASRYGYSYDDVTKTLTLIDWDCGTVMSKSGSGPATITLKVTRDTARSGEYQVEEGTSATVQINSNTSGGSRTIYLTEGDIFKVVVLNATVTIQ